MKNETSDQDFEALEEEYDACQSLHDAIEEHACIILDGGDICARADSKENIYRAIDAYIEKLTFFPSDHS